MRLFFDEDAGTGVAKAIFELLRHGVEWVGPDKKVKPGTPDEEWLVFVGRGNYLLISCNTGILNTDAQREILIREKVGAVFVDSKGATRIGLMQFMMRRWGWFNDLYNNEPRPFAITTTMRGKPKRDPRVH